MLDIFSLSLRGQSLASHAARADMDLFMQASQDLYHPEQNPNGKFPLNVAENLPMVPVVQKKLAEIMQASTPPDWVFQYTSMNGHPEVRETFAHFMEQHLCGCPVDPETIGFSAGASATIEVSSFLLSNTGDVVAIPAPSYPMYTHDMGVKSGLERFDLQTHTDLSEHGAEGPVTPALMDEALAEITQSGKTLKILLITTPDNPTGCMYSATRLRALADWCMTHKVHMVVSEIYGLSLVPGNGPEDTCSFAQIMQEKQSDYLHLWYAMSKDFGMSGLRFGVAHSLNKAFMAGFGNANIPHMVSNLTQWVVGEMLKDQEFLSAYIPENQKKLTASYTVVTDMLDALGIPYIPASGSLFIWADFSRFLDEESPEGEHALWMEIFHKTGVLLTPGQGFQHRKAGIFRIVHTAVPTDHMRVAMDRVQAYLGAI